MNKIEHVEKQVGEKLCLIFPTRITLVFIVEIWKLGQSEILNFQKHDLCSGHLWHLGAADKRCTGKDSGCCTKATPCDLGEGDCDKNDQCKGHFVTKGL